MTEQFVDPDAQPERFFFDEQSWADIFRGWMPDATRVYRELVDGIAWEQGRLWRYERWIDEPRLGASMAAGAISHPALAEAHLAIETRYHVTFPGIGLAYYRDGRDGQAFHRDR